MGVRRQFLRRVQAQLGGKSRMRDRKDKNGKIRRGWLYHLRKMNESKPGWWEEYLASRRRAKNSGAGRSA